MRHDAEPQPGSNFLGRPISRRGFLCRSAQFAAAGLALSACGGVAVEKEKTQAGTGIEITQKIEASLDNIWEVGAYRVYLDADGLPYKYADPAGSEVFFDVGKMQRARNFALLNQEPEVAYIIPVAEPSIKIGIPMTVSPDKPNIKDLPQDVLSPAQLAARGVKIIQADNTNLYIRRQAFEEGGPMEQFDGSRKLVIAVVNSSVVVPVAVSDSRYSEVAGLLAPLDTTIQKFKAERIAEISENLGEARDNYKKSQKQKTPVSILEGLEEILTDVKACKYRYENTLTDEELLIELSNDVRNEAGLYYSPKYSGIADTAVIFVAAGTMRRTNEEIQIVFGTDGKCALRRLAFTVPYGDFTPNTADSFPNPNDFIKNGSAKEDDPKSYLYGAQTAGQILWHELVHDKLIWEEGKPNSEYETDEKAMEGIRNGSDRWRINRDNSGYYFVFSLPNGDGYILTSAMPLETALKAA